MDKEQNEKEYQRQYYLKRKTELQEKRRLHYQENRNKYLESAKRFQDNHPEYTKEYNKNWYSRNEDYKRQRVQAGYEQRKEKAIHYLGGKCRICGLVDECLAVYDFHHLRDKERSLSSLMRQIRKWEQIVVELDKCCLLCCLCHRKVHAGILQVPS